MVKSIRHRLARGEHGFTLLELLVVVTIIGVLLAIAVPAYSGFKARAEKAAAKANVRAAVPSAEAYGADHSGYTGMTHATLKASYDPAVKVTVTTSAGATAYCLYSTVGSAHAHVTGPGGTVTTGNSC